MGHGGPSGPLLSNSLRYLALSKWRSWPTGALQVGHGGPARQCLRYGANFTPCAAKTARECGPLPTDLRGADALDARRRVRSPFVGSPNPDRVLLSLGGKRRWRRLAEMQDGRSFAPPMQVQLRVIANAKTARAPARPLCLDWGSVSGRRRGGVRIAVLAMARRRERRSRDWAFAAAAVRLQ